MAACAVLPQLSQAVGMLGDHLNVGDQVSGFDIFHDRLTVHCHGTIVAVDGDDVSIRPVVPGLPLYNFKANMVTPLARYQEVHKKAAVKLKVNQFERTGKSRSGFVAPDDYSEADVAALAELLKQTQHTLKFDCPRLNEYGGDVWEELNTRVKSFTGCSLESMGFRPIESGSRGGKTIRRSAQFRLYLPKALDHPTVNKFAKERGDDLVISNTFLLLDVWQEMEASGNRPFLEGIRHAA
jgi:hypothetical protein